jgi:hypothetical protein
VSLRQHSPLVTIVERMREKRAGFTAVALTLSPAMVERHSESVSVLSNFAVGSRRFQDILADRAGFQRSNVLLIQRYKNITVVLQNAFIK